jgi:hypothetical protein
MHLPSLILVHYFLFAAGLPALAANSSVDANHVQVQAMVLPRGLNNSAAIMLKTGGITIFETIPQREDRMLDFVLPETRRQSLRVAPKASGTCALAQLRMRPISCRLEHRRLLHASSQIGECFMIKSRTDRRASPRHGRLPVALA